ncbi:hypothetical protein SAMN05421812_117163 [Asanoa hainanensis]|uniref:Uncharacterized protein n=1 Tax=Asanoa hainanensis TaxID=560556 RepID=A0A239PC43_9ACTN|nr:hypothetical protein [Asanoa hainanensis]SNT64647.1 hypothetical protein SAMN05421812_117163 [Asanoa hainanensis]
MSAFGELKATGRLALWTLAWAATLALAKFGPQHVWDPPQQVASWAAVAVNVVVGAGWIVAFTRFLRSLDELQRKIMQDALAATLGVGWVLGFAYVVADQASLAAGDIDVAVLPVVMAVVFVSAFVVGKLRYR